MSRAWSHAFILVTRATGILNSDVYSREAELLTQVFFQIRERFLSRWAVENMTGVYPCHYRTQIFLAFEILGFYSQMGFELHNFFPFHLISSAPVLF